MTAGERSRVRGLPAIAAALLAACGGPVETPENAVRAWLERGERAAEEKDRAALMDMVSEAYADGRGNGRDELDRLLRLYFLRTQNITLLTNIEEIDVSGGSAALLTVSVGMAGTGGGAFGFDADAYRFEFELEADGDEWLLIGARWGELGETLR